MLNATKFLFCCVRFYLTKGHFKPLFRLTLTSLFLPMDLAMQQYRDCPQVLRDFLTYHENIKGQSPLTIREYYLDLRMFLRFMKLVRSEMPIDTDLETIDIRLIDLDFIASITTSEIFDFLSYLANDRVARPDTAAPEHGIEASSRARKLSAIKSFYKYLTVRTKQLNENPVADL